MDVVLSLVETLKAFDSTRTPSMFSAPGNSLVREVMYQFPHPSNDRFVRLRFMG